MGAYFYQVRPWTKPKAERWDSSFLEPSKAFVAGATEKNLAIEQRLNSVVPREMDLLCIRANRDEAGLWLGTLDQANYRFSYGFTRTLFEPFLALVSTMGGTFGWLWIIYAGSILNMAYSFQDDGAFEYLVKPYIGLIALVITSMSAAGLLAAAIAFVSALFTRSAPWGFGERVILCFLLNITTREVPPYEGSAHQSRPQASPYFILFGHLAVDESGHAGETTVKSFAYSRYSFQHSVLYQDPEVLKTICDWIEERTIRALGTQEKAMGA